MWANSVEKKNTAKIYSTFAALPKLKENYKLGLMETIVAGLSTRHKLLLNFSSAWVQTLQHDYIIYLRDLLLCMLRKKTVLHYTSEMSTQPIT